jgi:hypothetical protein
MNDENRSSDFHLMLLHAAVRAWLLLDACLVSCLFIYVSGASLAPMMLWNLSPILAMFCYPWLIALVGGSLITLWFLLENSRMIRNKRRRFSGRQKLDGRELQKLFPNVSLSLDEFIEFLTCVERATEIPKELLRPTDRFDVDLAAVRGWEFDDGLSLLPEVLSRRFGGPVEAYDLAEKRTLGELASNIKPRLTTDGISEYRDQP